MQKLIPHCSMWGVTGDAAGVTKGTGSKEETVLESHPKLADESVIGTFGTSFPSVIKLGALQGKKGAEER
jgi:hypothetical protein